MHFGGIGRDFIRLSYWLTQIDNGALFYFHHSWNEFEKHALNPFPHIKDHVLLPQASMLDEANDFAHDILMDDLLEKIATLVPDE
ncbi:MAG: hypothetical protein PWQ38_952 [Proteiniphilum sp.]|nr:hypothetical protein [Proteiniphilum sp.]